MDPINEPALPIERSSPFFSLSFFVCKDRPTPRRWFRVEYLRRQGFAINSRLASNPSTRSLLSPLALKTREIFTKRNTIDRLQALRLIAFESRRNCATAFVSSSVSRSYKPSRAERACFIVTLASLVSIMKIAGGNSRNTAAFRFRRRACLVKCTSRERNGDRVTLIEYRCFDNSIFMYK